MFYSPDQGATWYYLDNAEIPDVAINVVKVNPITDTLFIGTDRGLYYLNNTGDWNQLGTGLPNAAIFDITFTKSNYLIVGTHGRGAWLNYMTPMVTLSSAVGSYKSGKQLTVTITDPNGFSEATYNWDSSANTTAPASFNTQIPITEGVHTLYVYAKDPAGNWASKKYVFRTDNTSPVISLKSLTNGTNIEAGSTVQIQSSDASPIQTILYNWNTGSNSTGTVSGSTLSVIAPSATGQAILLVFVSDTAGNWVSATYGFTIIPATSHSSSTSNDTGVNTTDTNSSTDTAPGFEILLILISISTIMIRRKSQKN